MPAWPCAAVPTNPWPQGLAAQQTGRQVVAGVGRAGMPGFAALGHHRLRALERRLIDQPSVFRLVRLAVEGQPSDVGGLRRTSRTPCGVQRHRRPVVCPSSLSRLLIAAEPSPRWT
jgi:hypothetical protein